VSYLLLPVCIHPEDGNSIAYRNPGRVSTYDEAKHVDLIQF
jgi:hypothetical protein